MLEKNIMSEVTFESFQKMTDKQKFESLKKRIQGCSLFRNNEEKIKNLCLEGTNSEMLEKLNAYSNIYSERHGDKYTQGYNILSKTPQDRVKVELKDQLTEYLENLSA